MRQSKPKSVGSTSAASKRFELLLAVVAICVISSPSMAQGDAWRLDSIEVEKTYVGLNPAQKTESVGPAARSFKLGWQTGGKEISAAVILTEVPEIIRASSPYNFAAKITANVAPMVATQPDTIFEWRFWFASSRPNNRMIGSKAPYTTDFIVEDRRGVLNPAASFGGPPDPRETKGDFWETLQVSMRMDGLEIWGDMKIQMHYRWIGAPLPEPACGMGKVWSGGPGSKWVRRGSSNTFDVINGNEYMTGDHPGEKNAEVTLTFKDNWFIGKGRALNGSKECSYQGFVSGKEVRLRGVMCTNYSGPIPGGLYIECDSTEQNTAGTNSGSANTNLSNAGTIRGSSTPSLPSPAPRVSSRRTPYSPLTGRWSGSYVNSKRERGTSTIKLTEGPYGAITGDEGGWIIENGRRRGNVITWEYRNQNNGCRDYQVTLQLSADGNGFNGSYTVNDRCAHLTYTGQYVNYRRL